MITYIFLQQYWWFLIALLGGLLVFLLFVQGGNALIFLAGKNEAERELIINSTALLDGASALDITKDLLKIVNEKYAAEKAAAKTE